MRHLIWYAALTLTLALGGLWIGSTAPPADASAHASQSPAAANAPFDGQIDVGGRTLHLYCTGAGSPTVILEAGYGDDWSNWRLVQPALAPTIRVCSYDRAGIGESEAAPAPRSAADTATDLHALLQNAGLPGPYILVGSSYGGLAVRLYAATYPESVAGLVLVDPLHEDYLDRLEAIAPAQHAALVDLLESIPEGIDFAASAADIRAAGPLPDVPTVIITRGIGDFPPLDPTRATEQLWQELERDLASSIPNARLVVADHSGHTVNRSQPELIVTAIQQVATPTASVPPSMSPGGTS